MFDLDDVLSAVFQVFPTARLVGKYPIYYIQGRANGGLDRLDVVVNPVLVGDYELNGLKRMLGGNTCNLEKKVEFEGLTPPQYHFNMRNTNKLPKFTVNITGDLGSQSYLSIDNLSILSNGQIVPRKGALAYPDDVKKQIIQQGIMDISEGTIRLTKSLQTIRSSIDRKYAYIRILDLLIDLIGADPAGCWKCESPEEKAMFNIHTIGDREEIKDCVICMDNIEIGEVVIDLNCNHGFHATCFKQQISGVGSHHGRCSICRNNII